MDHVATYKTIKTDTLLIAYLESGSSDGWPVILTHGFPYDVHAYDQVTPILSNAGARVIVPYVRGYGHTRFLSPMTMRNGQQAALGKDIIDLMDALEIRTAVLGGFDWGGLASCVASILWPERIAGLVSYAGYDVLNLVEEKQVHHPTKELAVWYQHLFQTDRGRKSLTEHRRALCRMLWEQWSPGWIIDELRFEHAVKSWDNPDFVDIVLHNYRFAFGTAEGEPQFTEYEAILATTPVIRVPSITIDGSQDVLKPGGTFESSKMFVGLHEHRVVDCGHAIPYEAPQAFADAVLTIRRWQ